MTQPPFEPPGGQPPEEPTPSEGTPPQPQGAPLPPQEPPPPPASPYRPPPERTPSESSGQPGVPPVAPYGPPPEGSWQSAGAAPRQRVRRYERGVVVSAAAITVVALIALVVGASTLSGGFFTFGLFAVPILLVVSIVLSIVTKDVRQRSIWLGILIGCGLALIIGGGLCVAIIASLGY